MTSALWIGTRKGAFTLRPDPRRRGWRLSGPQFLGHIIHHVVQDPREPKVLLMAAKTGHLGPTVYRSSDCGRTWREATQPPAFRKAAEGEQPRAVERVFWLTPGHSSERGSWYAGTSPAGLFRSEDGGERWQPVAGFNDNPMQPKWMSFGTPDGRLTHSINIDPRDPRHLYLALSGGGVFESTDGGAEWAPLNEGCAADFLPDPTVPFGHDPHCVALHPAAPDRLYQQNHCGIYRLDRPQRRWVRIGNAMPKKVGDIGFPIVLHPTDPQTAWVLPMDGQTVWPRTSIAGKPAVYRTSDGGKSWRRLDRGLPRSQAWLTVLRQAMCTDGRTPRLGLYFGTTGGEVWAGANGGESWRCIARHLPGIYSVTYALQESPDGARHMSCTVRIPSPLRSYTAGAATVAAEGGTVAQVLASLEHRFAGIRFRMVDEQSRIRPHIRLYVNTTEVTALSQPVRSSDVVHVICALSGG